MRNHSMPTRSDIDFLAPPSSHPYYKAAPGRSPLAESQQVMPGGPGLGPPPAYTRQQPGAVPPPPPPRPSNQGMPPGVTYGVNRLNRA